MCGRPQTQVADLPRRWGGRAPPTFLPREHRSLQLACAAPPRSAPPRPAPPRPADGPTPPPRTGIYFRVCVSALAFLSTKTVLHVVRPLGFSLLGPLSPSRGGSRLSGPPGFFPGGGGAPAPRTPPPGFLLGELPPPRTPPPEIPIAENM